MKKIVSIFLAAGFPPNLRFLWDENADQYIRYETMYFAKALLLNRIAGQMEES